MLDYEDLLTFVEVADAGGISSASRRLNVSKSVVSRRLVRLETDLGIQLLARNTRGAALTEAGATFREHAARMCAEMDMAREAILPAGDLRGRLRIAAPLSLGPAGFVPVFAELAHAHPRLALHTSYSERYVDIVGEGFDCAIRIGNLPDSTLVARRVGQVQGTLVASPDYIDRHGAPDTPEDLLQHEALLQGTETWDLTVDGKVTTVHPRGRFKADNGTALAVAATAGLGIANLPDVLVRDQLNAGLLVPVMQNHPIPSAGIHVVRPPTQHPSRKVRVLTDMMIKHFG